MHVEERRSARDAAVVLHHDQECFEGPQRGSTVVPCNFCSQLRLRDGITGTTQRVVKGRLADRKGPCRSPNQRLELMLVNNHRVVGEHNKADRLPQSVSGHERHTDQLQHSHDCIRSEHMLRPTTQRTFKQ
jgi:hypothetical protein